MVHEVIESFCFAKKSLIMESSYVATKRTCCNFDTITCNHYYCVEIFFNIIELELSELDDCFLECLYVLLKQYVYLCPYYLFAHVNVL